jgi:anti-sigma factor RsiW
MMAADGSPHVVDSLSAYLDGDLPASTAARVRAHLDACEVCTQAATELGAMIGAARGLDRPEPPPTLWSSIEGELARHERGPLGWRLFAFGSLAGGALVLAVLWTGWTGLSVGRGRAGASAAMWGTAGGAARASAPTTGGPEAGAPVAVVDPLLAEAEQEFQRAADAYERSIGKLRTLLAREQSRWSVEERVRYADRLARLDESINRSRETARRQPGDAAGNEILFAAYQKKIEFLAAAVHRGAPGLGGNGP